jgi:hypothetical protein
LERRKTAGVKATVFIMALVNRNVAQDSILVFADEAHFRLIASFLAMTCLESWATMGLCFNLPKSSYYNIQKLRN